MFTNPIHEITFEDVQTFCQEWTEGVRVEYKREINVKKHIPKAVSSFANTLGGTLIIGVECDKEKNKVLSINGIPPENGFEERILETTLTHIYPAVIPTVKIVDMPDSDNMVVVVHVDESVQALIQFKTRQKYIFVLEALVVPINLLI
ncbi:MAG: ATP-binding protein [Candidatus Poribacteria bacterium]|nr:ATP-binding protein [Candidatus Poribacteria bacterium]